LITPRPELLTHGCARCGARWFGLDRAHCTACPQHRTFDDVELYDAHRPDGTCIPPSALGPIKNKGEFWQRRADRRRRAS
jgi:hypothetical protein